MSKLLINEPPLQVLPSLAATIGLNEALFLQQLHYWINQSGHEKDGQRWVYNTYDQWSEQFPFWSARTIRRIVASLREQGLILTTDKYNAVAIDNTLWYAIQYEEVGNLTPPPTSARNDRPCGQVGQTTRTEWTDQVDNLSASYRTETTTENTTDKKDDDDRGIPPVFEMSWIEVAYETQFGRPPSPSESQTLNSFESRTHHHHLIRRAIERTAAKAQQVHISNPVGYISTTLDGLIKEQEQGNEQRRGKARTRDTGRGYGKVQGNIITTDYDKLLNWPNSS